jgi:formate dehydrogenase subunit delta
MNIDLLIKMANEIGDFFTGASPPEQAARDVANHLKRYWEPRMRKQMLGYYEQRQGAGLSDVAKGAVGILYAQEKAAPPGAAPATPPAAPAPGAKA